MLMFVQVFFIYIKCVVQDKKTYSYTKFRLRMSQTNNQEEQQHATILLRLNRISLLFVIHCINIFSHNPTPTEKKKEKARSFAELFISDDPSLFSSLVQTGGVLQHKHRPVQFRPP